MPESIEIKPRSLNALLQDIEKGLLKIPRFQREVVWELSDSVRLLDSIYRGFPIGSFIIWETWEKLADVRSIGNLQLQEPESGQIPSYVLDGQQRLTSIFACAREAQVMSKKRKTPVRYVAWFDLDRRSFRTDKPENGVTLSQLIASNYDQYRDPLAPAHKVAFSKARQILLEEYHFPTIVVRKQTMEDACIIFERINNSGKKLTVFDLLVAKAYPLEFDLRAEWKKVDKELRAFSGINPILPMQALSLMTVKLDPDKVISGAGDRYGCHKRHLLKIDPQDIKGRWPDVKEGIKLTIDFMANHIGVPSTKLVPYEAPIALLTLFHLLNGLRSPTGVQSKQLADYFWAACISGRYAGSPESSMEEDAISIRSIVDGTFSPLPWSKPTTKEAVLDARYDRRDAMVRSILCLMASQRPLSFKSNTPIPIAKEFSHYNASDFHHVFPRGWLKTTGRSDWVKKEHSLANICFSPAREQRHEIRAKPPSEYINMFAATNPGIDLALASHVMGGVLKPLLVKDQFEEFLEKRASAIADLLNKNAHA